MRWRLSRPHKIPCALLVSACGSAFGIPPSPAILYSALCSAPVPSTKLAQGNQQLSKAASQTPNRTLHCVTPGDISHSSPPDLDKKQNNRNGSASDITSYNRDTSNLADICRCSYNFTMPRQPNPQNRLACDRCHGQKLRCPRQDGQGACQRCLRANATCVFSPRQKRTSPSANKEKQQPQPRSAPSAQSPPGQQSDGIDLDLLDPDILFVSGHPDGSATTSLAAPALPGDFMDTACADSTTIPTDWSNFLGLATPGPSPWEYSPHSGQSPSAQFRITPFLETGDQDPSSTDSSSGAADTPSSSSTADSLDGGNTTKSPVSKTMTVSLHSHIRRLADLAVKLYDQFNALPPVCDEVTEEITIGNLESAEMQNQLIAIDEIFKLTQSLIDIMIDFYPPDGQPSKVTPDQGALLLLLSCTDRVLDIFELLFGHMHACLTNKFIPMMPDGKPWALPELRIGSYTPPAPTAIAMHILTIILMASHLFDQLQEVLGVGRHGLAAGAATGKDASVVLASHDPLEVDLAVGMRSKFPNFTEEAKLAVTRRARSVATDIIKARGLLLSLPGMYGSGSFSTFAETAVAKD